MKDEFDLFMSIEDHSFTDIPHEYSWKNSNDVSVISFGFIYDNESDYSCHDWADDEDDYSREDESEYY